MTLQSKQNLEQCVVHETSNSDLSDQIARISTTVQNSAIEARQQFSAHHDQIRAISDQHTRVVKAGLQDLGESTAVIQNQFQGAIESLQQSLTVQLSKTHDNSQALHSTLQELLQQIRSSEKNPPQNNLSDELQDCIDRLYATTTEIRMRNRRNLRTKRRPNSTNLDDFFSSFLASDSSVLRVFKANSSNSRRLCILS